MVTDALAGQLAHAGWYAGRRVPIDAALTAYREAGLVPWPEAEDLLTEFDGLRIYGPDNPHPVTIDACETLADTDQSWLASYERAAGTTLIPVGEYYAMVIHLGQDGWFYGGYDGDFGKLDDNVRDLVDSILNLPPQQRLSIRLTN